MQPTRSRNGAITDELKCDPHRTKRASILGRKTTQSYHAFRHETNYILFFAPWGAPAPQTLRVGGLPPPKPPAEGLGGGNPPTRGVWGAGAPKGAKNNIKCPKGQPRNSGFQVHVLYSESCWSSSACRFLPQAPSSRHDNHISGSNGDAEGKPSLPPRCNANEPITLPLNRALQQISVLKFFDPGPGGSGGLPEAPGT
jgi:hypothetical protein